MKNRVVRVGDGLWTKVQERAEKEERSVADWVREALTEKLNREVES